eukprot:477427_1
MDSTSQTNNTWWIIWTAFNIFLILTITNPVYKTIKKCLQRNKDVAKFVFYLALVLIANTILLYMGLISIGCGLLFQSTTKILETMIFLFSALYAFQNYFMLLIFFIRLYLIFKSTAFTVSKSTTHFFISIFTALPIICVFLALLPRYRGTLMWSLLISIFIGTIITLYISLLSLFLYKLCQAQKYENSHDQILLPIISKVTLLAIICICSTFLAPLSIVIRFNFDETHFSFISNCLVSIDIYIKLFCVMLSFACYQTHYKILCGWLESCCCKKCFSDDLKTAQITIATNTNTQNTVQISNTQKAPKIKVHLELPVISDITTETSENNVAIENKLTSDNNEIIKTKSPITPLLTGLQQFGYNLQPVNKNTLTLYESKSAPVPRYILSDNSSANSSD